MLSNLLPAAKVNEYRFEHPMNAPCAIVETLAGTLAGDDTAFLAMKDSKAAEDFCHEIDEMF